MKKLLFLLAILTFVLGSCSKEARLNRKLDGIWKLSYYNDVSPTFGVIDELHFTKEKYGKGKLEFYSDSIDTTGTYELDKDKKITMYLGQDKYDTIVFLINHYSRSYLTLNLVADKITYPFYKETRLNFFD